jgi:hypothetical protein
VIMTHQGRLESVTDMLYSSMRYSSVMISRISIHTGLHTRRVIVAFVQRLTGTALAVLHSIDGTRPGGSANDDNMSCHEQLKLLWTVAFSIMHHNNRMISACKRVSSAVVT